MVEKDVTRKAVNITWDTEAVQGPHVNLRAENADDISLRNDLTNDGYAVVTYPADYHGTSHITITGSESGSDEGDIEV